MHQLLSQIEEAAAFIRRRWNGRPEVGIILGTGLDGLAAQIAAEAIVPFAEIPHFPRATALGHHGRVVCGTTEGLPVVATEGRYHLYEGYDPRQVTLPVRVMSALGATILIVSNASGGLNPGLRSGDVVILDDHINLMFRSPLIGLNDERLGPRFPDMSCPYDVQLVQLALRIAGQQDLPAHRGVYAGVTGPNYETRAEYRLLRRLGADVVGMSTVPEVLAAVHAGMRILGLSAVTNLCRPEGLGKTSGEEVVLAAQTAAPRMRRLVLGVLAELRSGGV